MASAGETSVSSKSVGDSNDKYGLKRNWVSSIRLNLQHYLWKDTTGYDIHPSILSQVGSSPRIADVGTGTGIWMSAVQRSLPSAQVDGFDISLAQCPVPSALLNGSSVKQMDVYDPVPEALQGIYDIVHIRLFLVVVKDNDPVPVIKNLMAMLKPGGFLQWDEHNISTMTVEANAESKRTAMDSMATLMRNVSTGSWTAKLGQTLKDQNLVDVETHIHPTPPDQRLYWTQMQFNSNEDFSFVAMDNTNADSPGPKLRQTILAAAEEAQQGGAVLNFGLECHVARKT